MDTVITRTCLQCRRPCGPVAGAADRIRSIYHALERINLHEAGLQPRDFMRALAFREEAAARSMCMRCWYGVEEKPVDLEMVLLACMAQWVDQDPGRPPTGSPAAAVARLLAESLHGVDDSRGRAARLVQRAEQIEAAYGPTATRRAS